MQLAAVGCMLARLALKVLLAAALSPVQAAGQDSAREFPFEFREGLIWVKVRVPESVEPLNFLLDSGASVSVVRLRAAKRLGLKLGQPVKVQGVGANITGYERPIFAGEAGLLGNDLLSRFGSVTIDERRGQVILGSNKSETRNSKSETNSNLKIQRFEISTLSPGL
jgi:hypothetical protein